MIYYDGHDEDLDDKKSLFFPSSLALSSFKQANRIKMAQTNLPNMTRGYQLPATYHTPAFFFFFFPRLSFLSRPPLFNSPVL